MTTTIPTLLTTEEAAKLIRVAPNTMRQWRCRNSPRGPRYLRTASGRILYRESDLAAWLGLEAA